MLRRFTTFVDDYGLMPNGTNGLIAFSGGPDSLCLLDLSRRLAAERNIRLRAIHIDHGLRDEAHAEADQAQRLAEELGVAVIVHRLTHLRQGRGNLQERAREARWRVLQQQAISAGFDWIALGHNADDQAETVLMRALRGTGLRGLGAIAPRVGRCIHPLLFARRLEIKDYLARYGLQAVEDPTNATDDYLRNRVRHHVMPTLTRENPRVVEAFCRLAQNCREDGEALDQLAQALWTRVRQHNGLLLDELRDQPPGLLHRVLVLAYEHMHGTRRELTRNHVLKFAQLARGSSGTQTIHLPGVHVERCYDRLTLRATPDRSLADQQWADQQWADQQWERAGRFHCAITAPGQWPLGSGVESTLEVTLGTATGARCDELPRDRIRFPLVIRSLRPGDRIAVGPGMERKLSRVLIDAKVPRSRRSSVPIVITDEQIVLLVGIRRAWGWGGKIGDPVVRFCVQER